MMWKEYDDEGIGAGRKLSVFGNTIFESSYVATVLVVMFIFLAVGLLTPEIIVFLALLFVWVPGIITTEEAMHGFSNEGMLTIGVLFVIVQSTHRSHIVPRIARNVFGMHTSIRTGLFRLCVACYILSAFLNNTPIVSILIPVTRDWARTRGFAPSQFLIPLSYACILGGAATIIGTSTNLVVQGMIDEKYQFSFFDPAKVAFPVGVVGIFYLVCFAPLLLPKNWGLFSFIRDRTGDLITELHIEKGFKYIGMPVSIMLMNLGLDPTSIVKIRRKVPVCPQEVVESNQREKENIMEYWEKQREDALYHENFYRDRTAHLWGHRLVSIGHTYSSDGIDIENRPWNSECTKLMKHRSYSQDEFHMGKRSLKQSSCSADSLSENNSQLPYEHQNSGKKHVTKPAHVRSVTDGFVHRRERSKTSGDEKKEDNISLNGWDGDLANSNSISRSSMEGEASYADVWPVSADERLQVGDFLFLSVGLHSLLEFQKQASSVLMLQGLRFITCDALDIPGKGTDFFEVVLSPQNHVLGMDGHRVPNFERYFKCSVLALRKRGEIEAEPIDRHRQRMDTSKSTCSAKIDDSQQPNPKGDTPDLTTTYNSQHSSGTEFVHNNIHMHAAVEAMERPWETGDTVLLFASKDFNETWKNTSQFLLISSVGNVPKRVTVWDYIPAVLFLVMLIIVISGLMSMMKAAFFISGVLLILKFIPAHEALQAVNWELLLLIGSSLGLSASIEGSGLAEYIGDAIFSISADPRWILMILYFVVMIMTEMITNNAAAALVVPVATTGATSLGFNPQPFYLAIMLAASASFITPIGYQTNTMVWAPGGYKFSDFAKVGLPLSLISLLVSCFLIPVKFPFCDNPPSV